MLIEDGAQFTAEALKLLDQHKDGIGLPNLTVQSLPEFVASIKEKRLNDEDRRMLVDQALLLFENFYAHLPFKRSRYAVDPLQRLQLLRAKLSSLRDFEFHSELQSAFVGLRDAHTVYGLPAPYKGKVAFLPFRLDCVRDQEGNPRFVVTAIMEGFKHQDFNVRAEVTGWNGMRVPRAIQRVAEGEPGANLDANFARGLRRLTVRPLTTSLPPD
ncbi:MAG: hypothetical protein ABIZ80_17300, partial [Bryobacteraceae bacterium]